jgi:colicin import membrane protein
LFSMFSSPFLPSTQQLLWHRIAIIFIAASAHSSWAQAQNTTEKTAIAQEQIERQRIAKERIEASALYEQQRRACYQQFAVTPCLEQARDSYNELIRDLKRQEVSLNDAKRRRAGADSLRAIENRNSNEAQLAQAQRRGKALDAASQRQARQEAKEQNRQNKEAAASSAQANPVPSSTDVQKDASKPAAPKRATRESRPATKSAPDPALLERNRAQSAEREKAAQIRREKIKEREAKRSKPPAAPLPIPPIPPAPAK